MQDYHKQWKTFLNETEVAHEIDARLEYDKGVRNQTYILHDVREIEGVRVVTVTSPVETHGGVEQVDVVIKYDVPPGNTPDGFISFLKVQIRKIQGIRESGSVIFLRKRTVEI